MNQAIKKKWLAKLKTSRKARKKLRSSNGGYCCLGVLCTLYQEETGLGGWVRNNKKWDFMDATLVLPPDVLEWSELDLDNQGCLAELNDNQVGFPIESIEKL